jgi:ABC-type polar amino acid transport system ATPase subunit
VNEPSVLLRAVGKRFGAREVLREIHAAAAPGSIVSLVGSSGSGKTTLLRCMNGLERIDSGEIRIGGHLVEANLGDAALTRLRADVGMVFQDYQLFPHLSVLDNLCLAPQVVRKRSRAQAERRAAELLERVGLADRAASRPSDLSGGQKQRVALARAIAQEVKVLLLDEPTSALDAATRDDVVRLLKDLVQRSEAPLTLVLVTHDLHVAESLSDQVWRLVDGQLAAADAEATPRGR